MLKLWGYKVEEKLYVGVREQKRLNTAGLDYLHNFKATSLHYQKNTHICLDNWFSLI
jgi:hypothetical protein